MPNDLLEPADCIPGKGYRNRVIDRLLNKVQARDAGSPFLIAAKSTTDAILKLAKDCAGRLEQTLNEDLQDMENLFYSMVSHKAKDPAEEPVRLALQRYFQEHEQASEVLKHRLRKVMEKPQYLRVEEEEAD